MQLLDDNINEEKSVVGTKESIVVSLGCLNLFCCIIPPLAYSELSGSDIGDFLLFLIIGYFFVSLMASTLLSLGLSSIFAVLGKLSKSLGLLGIERLLKKVVHLFGKLSVNGTWLLIHIITTITIFFLYF